jgi:hypothetical protein
MTGRKRLGMFLAVAGLLLLATAGFFWRGDAGRRAEIKAELATLADSADRVHDRVEATNLKFRGFRESQASMPDSVKRHGGAIVMEITQGYNKTIRKLELSERDIRLEMSALKREAARERAQARVRAIPVAGGGLVALLIGAILLLLPGRPVGA